MHAVATKDRAAPTPVLREGRLGRAWRLPLGWHALTLGVLLLCSMLLTSPDQLGHADEGAALSQTELLLDGEGWSATHPLPDADPEGHAFPIGGSERRVGTDEYVPFSKHPVYPVLLMPFVSAFGVAGGALLSILGTVAAAVGTALLARRLDTALARPAFWFLGVATPMWFDSFITIAHPLGAAAVAFAALLLLGRRPGPVQIVAGSSLLAFGVLLRNETTLLAVALATVVGAWALARRDRRQLLVAVSVFAATAFAYLLDARLASMARGGDPVEPFSIASTGTFLGDRVGGFMFTVLAPSDGTPIGLLLGALGTVLVIAAALVARRRPDDGNGILVFLGSALVAEIARWVIEPRAHVPGLVFAAPVLVGGLLLLDRATVARRDVAVPLAASGLFFGAVVATQYANGGGGGWGGRYFAIALPLVVPIAALAIQRAGRSVAASVRAPIVALAAAVAVVLAIGSSTAILVDHRLNGALGDRVAAATAQAYPGDGDARPVVITTRRGIGRLLFRQVLEQRWLEVPADDEDLAPYLERLRAQGVERLVVVTRDPDSVAADASSLYVVVGRSDVVTDDVFGRPITSSSKVLVLEAVNLP